MKYKFQVGDLVKVDRGHALRRPGGLALITGRREREPLVTSTWRGEIYTVSLVTGEEYEEHGELLTKVNK